MDQQTKTLIGCFSEIGVGFLVLILNGFVLFRFVLKHNGFTKHFKMLFLKMTFDTAFVVADMVYDGFIILNIYDLLTDIPFICYPGIIAQAFLALLGFVSLAIAIDRLVAILKPIKYNIRYAQIIHKSLLSILCVVFLTNSVVLMLARNENTEKSYSASKYFNVDIVYIVDNCSRVAFMLSFAVTLAFLFQFYHFLKRHQMGTRAHLKNVKLASTTVILHMIAEILFIICPFITERIIYYVTKKTISHFVGRFSSLVHVLYVAVCSFMLFAIMKKNRVVHSLGTITHNASSTAI
ncbi:hypothetical protein L596_015833 [Steinernema carpocapsae]|uniref:G-protein coupled receptors family 1 profile domain-containing protein n=1 Tax=Steinernema carpocapsae TaxID=34508 RepID=A0A4U5NH03_STECR|nr:hypothetical protein L596_015833 [Steinernema carpocapsae]